MKNKTLSKYLIPNKPVVLKPEFSEFLENKKSKNQINTKAAFIEQKSNNIENNQKALKRKVDQLENIIKNLQNNVRLLEKKLGLRNLS